MHVGEALVAHARAIAKRSIVVVGTAKNVGKTVTVTAMGEALQRRGERFAMCSIGHDGEAVDVLEGNVKPRILLHAGTLFATAATLLPAHPAVEVVDMPGEESALGPIVIGRVRASGHFEIAGPPSATALRRVIELLYAHGAENVLVDGAIDRIAAVREDDAIVIATGAAAGPTPTRVVGDVAAVAACLTLPTVDESREAIEIDGALSAAMAAAFARAGERRQIVVRDATRIAAPGRTLAAYARALDLRCERALHPIACTVSSIAGTRSFEPQEFLRAVARAVRLPCYDVYAGARA